MRQTRVFALGFVAVAALALAGTVGAIGQRNRDAFPVGELVRAETIPDASPSTLDDHLNYMFEIFGGQRRATPTEHELHVTPAFGEQFPADVINLLADQVIVENGPITFVRVEEREPLERPTEMMVIAVAGDGTTGSVALVSSDADHRIDGFLFADHPDKPRRLPAWESALTLIAAWLLLAASVVAWEDRSPKQAWLLLTAALPTLAGFLVLAEPSALYTAGRVIPAVVVVLGVALLLGHRSVRENRFVLAIAGVAMLIGALAPFVRDSAHIGHPEIAGSFADKSDAYRALLAAAAGLTAVAMGWVAALNFASARRIGEKMQPAYWATAVIGVVWAIAAFGAAIDAWFGDGVLAYGPFRAATLVALVLVPVAVVFHLIAATWDRAELAALVIDLEGEGGADLQPAISRALEDPTLQVLVSLDGDVLVDDDERPVAVEEFTDGRSVTRIQTGGRLIGALVHSSELQRNPGRLEAVAAAAGMALEVNRLNLQVMAQLDEVDASRARILGASDSARRRVERDLHDGAQQRLVALGLRLQRARRLAGAAGEDQLAVLLEEATGEVRDTIAEIRAVSHGARPALLAERGLATAVDALAERAPVPVQLEITASDLPSSAETTAYYVIAEGLTNIAKHSMATSAEVSITRRNGVACVIISDDGTGGATMTAGSGLEGLKDRVAATGGALDVSSGPGGTTLKATIPCE